MKDIDDKDIERLQSAAMKEGEFVWSRYSAMTIANTVLAGFTSSLMTEPNSRVLIIFMSTAGAFLCILWFCLTQYGFSLSKEWWEASYEASKRSNCHPFDVYIKWEKKHTLPNPFKWIALAVIFLFFALYLFLLSYQIFNCNIRYSALFIGAFAPLPWYFSG